MQEYAECLYTYIQNIYIQKDTIKFIDKKDRS